MRVWSTWSVVVIVLNAQDNENVFPPNDYFPVTDYDTTVWDMANDAETTVFDSTFDTVVVDTRDETISTQYASELTTAQGSEENSDPIFDGAPGALAATVLSLLVYGVIA